MAAPRGLLTDLFGQVVLHPHLLDLIQLGFDPIQISLFVFQDGFHHSRVPLSPTSAANSMSSL